MIWQISIREGMKAAEQRMKELQKLIENGENYLQYKFPVHSKHHRLACFAKNGRKKAANLFKTYCFMCCRWVAVYSILGLAGRQHFLLFGSQANAFCRYVISECKIMFYEDHCRRKFPNQIFNLHSRIDVNIVKRFIPHIQMCLFTKAFCYQHFFFCPAEKSSIFFSNCIREKSIFRKIALNKLSSTRLASANSDEQIRLIYQGVS